MEASVRPCMVVHITAAVGPPSGGFLGRVSHSSTSQLNLSAFNGIGGARRGCVARVEGVLEGLWAV